MSFYQQRNRHRLSIGQDGNALTMILAINICVFLVLAFIKLVYKFSGGTPESFYTGIFQYLILPAKPIEILYHPWTLLTHMFVHDVSEIWGFIGNLIWLWAFGFILQDLAGNRKIFPLYFYGSLVGATVFVLCMNIFPGLRQDVNDAYLFGGATGVMAVAIATTTLAPDYRVFTMLNGGIPIWVVTLIYLVITLASITVSNAPGLYIAQIGGAGFGFLYVRTLQKGHDLGIGLYRVLDWFDNLFDPEKPLTPKKKKTQLFYKSKVQPFTRKSVITQQRVDEILDKIGQKGYASLSEEEKDILRRSSEEL